MQRRLPLLCESFVSLHPQAPPLSQPALQWESLQVLTLSGGGQSQITVKMSLRKQTPSDFLKQIIGRPVVVKLNSGVDYRGVLACLDGYMNIAIEQTEEYVNGQLKNKYGDAFLRGNNEDTQAAKQRRLPPSPPDSQVHLLPPPPGGVKL
ncbi:U6 snRNA-associated [Collichthys lucidus]|uniref:U6 snRNA-associated Sm-like protein LSm6 n=1 Tax=Collichthys lucidus TaxID=240159 RepID=A0A4U5U2P2_COLLU|nr:U6 snRNA-associated [Collichthys lucidus]